MAERVSPAVRQEVRERAGVRCEYRLMPESELFTGCEVDHVISRKHGGVTDPANLALCCERCNLR
jgi:5-methylcytosine-specific restriction endonuclease McrA